MGQMQLFTENTITVVLPFLKKPSWACLGSIARLWTVVLAANLAGCLLLAAFLLAMAAGTKYQALAQLPGFALAFIFACRRHWLRPAAKAAAVFLLFGFKGQGRDRGGVAGLVQGHKGQKGRGHMPDLAVQQIFGFRPHANLHGGPAGQVDAGLENQKVADKRRVDEIQAVDGGGHHIAAGVPEGGHAGRAVDVFHDDAAVNIAGRVGVFRQQKMGQNGPAGRGGFGIHGV